MTNATTDPDAHPALLDTGNLKGFIPNMTAQNSTTIVGAPSSSTARLANNGLITANLEFQGTLCLPNHPHPVCGFQGFAFDQLHAKPGDPHIVAVKDLTPYFEVLLRDYAVSYLRHLTTDVIVNLKKTVEYLALDWHADAPRPRLNGTLMPSLQDVRPCVLHARH